MNLPTVNTAPASIAQVMEVVTDTASGLVEVSEVGCGKASDERPMDLAAIKTCVAG